MSIKPTLVYSATLKPVVEKLNPFILSDNEISHLIIGTHNSQATKYDVDSLYAAVSNIIKNSTQIGDQLEKKNKRFKFVELVENKVTQPSFMPSLWTLKEISCQMTCKSFDAFTAHETIVGILEKLRNYSWDAKAVIALAAFSLDYGESWRLSQMLPTDENSIEVHLFRLGEEDKAGTIAHFKSLVEPALQLIKGIIWLEQKIASRSYGSNDVSSLYKAPRDIYTYWAIFALLACASRISESDFKYDVSRRISLVISNLELLIRQIELEIKLIEDYRWRFTAIQTPSGILELLKALIFPRDIQQAHVFDGTDKKLVELEVLKTKNLLLFISGLDNIKDEIWVLRSIYGSFQNDKDKLNYTILWVPVVHTWGDEEKAKFEDLKSKMPWYVIPNFSLIEGFKALELEWNYQGKPIVVVTNPRGEIINKNATYLIFVWKIEAFPFRPEDGDRLSQNWQWLWNEATKVHPDIGKWIHEEKYIFLYGGTDSTVTKRFGDLVSSIKGDATIKQADAEIEQFNLGEVRLTIVTEFWENINNLFLSKTQKDNYEKDPALREVQELLSMKSEKGWALLSKGPKLLKVDYFPIMFNVIEEFKEWKEDVFSKQGFDNAFISYYERRFEKVPRHCSHFQLNNIRSGLPFAVYCPDPKCEQKMEIASVNYTCCHGNHHVHVLSNSEGRNAVGK